MHISFSPQRRDDTLEVAKAGDVLTINGEAFDFSALPNGATIPAGQVPCEWVIGPIDRVNGELRLTLVLPHGANPSPNVAFPLPLIDPADGHLAIPFDAEEPANVEG